MFWNSTVFKEKEEHDLRVQHCCSEIRGLPKYSLHFNWVVFMLVSTQTYNLENLQLILM